MYILADGFCFITCHSLHFLEVVLLHPQQLQLPVDTMSPDPDFSPVQLIGLKFQVGYLVVLGPQHAIEQFQTGLKLIGKVEVIPCCA